ncbi:hypothetical protein KDJ04_gp35 [Arthrobacter phage Nubia]|uniref:Uncharacterized protein n=3 Tax=Korravirus TaxID=1982076 RepID=A0A1I9SDZ5_9CAUD|nr:hypothetical protein KDJ04_gp35 [Arthrobacter phage Nubia]YP_010050387.1 hypothetical protein KDJ05_gp35 [Arthrobacter phage Oxynfrius]UYL86762.1 hypothetical protein SEA_ALBANESE_35 [Arthrobacter phage Albanese]WKW85592.1 hypothetical protein SEA_LAKSHMI_35 [Arthrobacter phage Lakshmi]AOZ65072.1 hypothetical protein SEA_OXYNFRIUS_35 [Arthrobacter phage Oxynfrius]ASR83768.1 hypothetical protein SEA_NUBIA_35 [Arthrobacter phage Nubia]
MFKVIGENSLTGNKWDCEVDIATREEANRIRKGYKSLESDYKITYYVVEEVQTKTRHSIPAHEVKIGDELLTDAGWVIVGGTITTEGMGTSDIGLLTPKGMITCAPNATVNVRRAD